MFLLKKRNTTRKVLEVTTEDLIPVVPSMHSWVTSYEKITTQNVKPMDIGDEKNVMLPIDVHSKLQFLKRKSANQLSEHEKIREKILCATAVILNLPPGCEIEMLAFATKGSLPDHDKWRSVETAKMHQEIKISLHPVNSKQLSKLQKKELIEVCPQNVFRLNGMTQDIEIVNEGVNCIDCAKCINFISTLQIEKPPERIKSDILKRNRIAIEVESDNVSSDISSEVSSKISSKVSSGVSSKVSPKVSEKPNEKTKTLSKTTDTKRMDTKMEESKPTTKNNKPRLLIQDTDFYFDDPSEILTMQGNETEHVSTIESMGAFPAKDLIRQGIEKVIEMLETLRDSVMMNHS